MPVIDPTEMEQLVAEGSGSLGDVGLFFGGLFFLWFALKMLISLNVKDEERPVLAFFGGLLFVAILGLIGFYLVKWSLT